MNPTRRAFLGGCAAAPFAASLPSIVSAELTLGTASLTTVSDGSLLLPAELVFAPMPQNELADIRKEFDVQGDRLTPECNLAFYRDGTNTVLFDVGSGPDFVPTAGSVLDSLDAVGVSAEDVTHVLFTHAHPDHIWGLLDDFDEPVFSDATYMMGRAEWDYWWNPETVETIGEARQSFAVGAKRRMAMIEDSVKLFDDGEEVLPGIQAILTAGHTPGHMAFEVRNGTQAALIVGDAIGNNHVAFRRPEWPSGSDQDMVLGSETRAKLLNRLSTEDLALVGFHLPNGGIGRVETNNGTYRFIPS